MLDIGFGETRTIKFRAMKLNKNKWVYGSIVIQDNDYYIYAKMDKFYFKYKVLPKSVGQYTCKNTSAGISIFEGDLVKDENNDIFEVMFDNGCFYGKYKNGNILDFVEWIDHKLHIIGNKFENS